MLNRPQPAIADLVPHRGRMCLLDRVLDVTANTLTAEVTPTTDSLFCQGGQIGAWVGIEYMAQAIAAWAGSHARALGRTPRIGFLLGTRIYEASTAYFVPGQTLTVEIELQFRADNGLGQFACRILQQGSCLASAQLKVFEPQDEDTRLESTR